MKKIPYAVGNFEQIVTDGYYYVDKTRYIAELENWQVPLFLRPRRFGKSLWCSTLECYYDITAKTNSTPFLKKPGSDGIRHRLKTVLWCCG